MRTEAETKALVRERYAAVARGEGGCCGTSSCGCGEVMAPDGLDTIGDAYRGVAGHVAEADLRLGCGVPTRHAALRPGESVLDLGSGAGNDAFIARHEVGADGRVLGVDMTALMVAKARPTPPSWVTSMLRSARARSRPCRSIPPASMS